MWEDADYCWVVICKKRWFHFRQSLFAGHRTPLALTDAVTPRPMTFTERFPREKGDAH